MGDVRDSRFADDGDNEETDNTNCKRTATGRTQSETSSKKLESTTTTRTDSCSKVQTSTVESGQNAHNSTTSCRRQG
jgi:hypothetical protein